MTIFSENVGGLWPLRLPWLRLFLELVHYKQYTQG